MKLPLGVTQSHALHVQRLCPRSSGPGLIPSCGPLLTSGSLNWLVLSCAVWWHLKQVYFLSTNNWGYGKHFHQNKTVHHSHCFKCPVKFVLQLHLGLQYSFVENGLLARWETPDSSPREGAEFLLTSLLLDSPQAILSYTDTHAHTHMYVHMLSQIHKHRGTVARSHAPIHKYMHSHKD